MIYRLKDFVIMGTAEPLEHRSFIDTLKTWKNADGFLPSIVRIQVQLNYFPVSRDSLEPRIWTASGSRLVACTQIATKGIDSLECAVSTCGAHPERREGA